MPIISITAPNYKKLMPTNALEHKISVSSFYTEEKLQSVVASIVR